MMTYPILSAALLLALVDVAAGGVSISSTAPSGNILASKSGGSIDTSLFPLAGTAPSPIPGDVNHARGQLFSLGDGVGTAFQITAITFQKNIAATFTNDLLTLRIFEGTQAQWDSGTGHTVSDSTFYKETSVTPRYEEAFTLSGLIGDDQYITLQLATPLVVSENSDFGFFLTYDPSSGSSPVKIQHLEGSDGGRISITTSDHAVSTRSMNYFVQGTAISAGSGLALGNPSVTDITTSGASLGMTVSGGSGITQHGTSFWAAGGAAGDNVSSLGTLTTVPSVIIDPRVGMNPGTLYSYAGYATNASEGTVFSATGTFLTEPNASNGLVVAPASGTSIQVSWSDDASAAGAVVVMREGSAPGPPSDGTIYTGNTNFGSGGAAGGGYVVHSGPYPGSPITVSVPGGTYHVAVYAYADASGQARNYNDHDSPPRGSATAVPALKLAAPFQNGMVLQRGKPVAVWGLADPNTAVSATINGSTAVGNSNAEGKWKVMLPTLTAGGPYQLAVTSGASTVTLSNVLVGDVWLAFGQSNMVRPLSEMSNNTTYINDIKNNGLPVRCLKVTQFGNLAPQENPVIPAGHTASGANASAMSWLASSTVDTWSAVGTVFAHKMYLATGVPTAIIWAAWGSSSIEGWMPAEMAAELPHFAKHMTYYSEVGNYTTDADYNNVTKANNLGFATNQAAVASLQATGWAGATSNSDIFMRTRPNALYNHMIHPLLNFGISGFVWYQGEANSDAIQNVVQYGFTLPRFVKEYRKRFNQGDLPFLGVQLPSYTNGISSWPWFRESQNRAASEPNTYLAVTIDTGLSTNIHPTDKEPVGTRLSLLARKYVHGESIEAEGPTFSSMSISGNQATVTFTHAGGLTTDNGASPLSFQLAGSNQVFYAATSASINGSTVTVSSSSVPSPVAVRYAWAASPYNPTDLLNLINSAGLPAVPFRTDTWPVPGLGAWAPQSVADAYEVQMNQVLNVAADGVLKNDMDLNFDPLSAVLVSSVSKGLLSFPGDGSFTYTPDVGYAGTDSFSYRCSDGGLSSPVTSVSITVVGQTTAFYTWKSTIAWGPGDDDSAEGDPDGDGISNFLEFAFGIDPLTPGQSGLPTLTPNGADFDYDFNNAQPGVNYEVLLSSDMVTWSDPPFAQVTSESTTPVVIPASEAEGGRLFVRLRVVE